MYLTTFTVTNIYENFCVELKFCKNKILSRTIATVITFRSRVDPIVEGEERVQTHSRIDSTNGAYLARRLPER